MKNANTLQKILQHWHKPETNLHVNNVIEQIKQCRTASLGYHLYQCTDRECKKYHYRYHSCRNRHCPQCGGFQKQQWIEDRMNELLPTNYFHVVFTLPHELNSCILGNRKLLLKLLFDTSAQTLLTFSKDKKYLGATPGILSLLHTWGQQLSFHPHVHCIISSGGIDNTSGIQYWRDAVRNSKQFIFPIKALAKVFRAKYLMRIKIHLKNNQLRVSPKSDLNILLKELYKKEWVVYAKRPFGGPQQVISYLGRYTHKTAITNSRIVRFDSDNNRVQFKYKDYADNSNEKLMEVNACDFVTRFKQHILPKRFTRIRSYGYLANRGRTERIKEITKMMNIPAHPIRVKISWQTRLLLQVGKSINCCPNCHKETLIQIASYYKHGHYG